MRKLPILCALLCVVVGAYGKFTYGVHLEGFYWDKEFGNAKTIEAGINGFHLEYTLSNYDFVGPPFHGLTAGYGFMIWKFYVDPGVAIFVDRNFYYGLLVPTLALEYPLFTFGKEDRKTSLNLRLGSNLFFKSQLALGLSLARR